MTPEVTKAIEELREAFPTCEVTFREDAEGGALVTMNPIDLGPAYLQDHTWIKFHITFQYPYSDVYPHFVRPDLARADGQPLGEGMAMTSSPDGEPAVQISRRSNRLNPATDTATLKLTKVLDWLRTR
jgi:hypothetical protein